MFHPKIKSKLVNIFLRGDVKEEGEDKYLTEFHCQDLVAARAPVIGFQFKNLEELRSVLDNLPAGKAETLNGIIVTSPRVVEAIELASRDSKTRRMTEVFCQDLVFVVGQKSAEHWQDKLGVPYNQASSMTGNGSQLCQLIIDQLRSYFSRGISINLLYPRSSRADNLIKDTLTDLNDKLTLYTIDAYDTAAIDHLDQVLKDCLAGLQVTGDVILNLVLFSPSGVEAISKVDLDDLVCNWRCLRKDSLGVVKVKFTSIGETTRRAMIKYGMDVFAVASSPSPPSLLECISKACGML